MTKVTKRVSTGAVVSTILQVLKSSDSVLFSFFYKTYIVLCTCEEEEKDNRAKHKYRMMKSSLISLSLLAAVLSLASHKCNAFVTGDAFLARTTSRVSASLAASTSTSGNEAASDYSAPPPIVVADANHPLIKLANDIMYTKSGFYSPYDESFYSEEFVFRGPFIGPLNREDYFETMATFGIYKAIPDISPNAFGFSIDPLDPNRVWFMVRNTGTFTGEPGLGFGGGNYYPPNGATLEGCPETFSMTFDSNQKLKYLTVGYVSDRFQGNTNGAGAAVGIFNVIGIPFPKPGPVLKFVQWAGTEVYNTGAHSYSTKNIPAWWKSEEKASEGY